MLPAPRDAGDQPRGNSESNRVWPLRPCDAVMSHSRLEGTTCSTSPSVSRTLLML